MASTVPGGQPVRSIWGRMIARLTDFAEAAEMDATAFLEARIAQLERRIAALECGPITVTKEGN